MTKRTRKLQFDTKTKKKIAERDLGCIFCRQQYHMPEGGYNFELNVFDVMHVVNKSQGGLGVEKNGVIGCRYHHHLMDNGTKGLDKEMRDICIEHIISEYGFWNEEEVTFQKYA